MNTLRHLLRRQDGATAIEYGLLAALIAIGIIVGAEQVGVNLAGMFGTVDNELSNAVAATPAPAPAPAP